MFVLAALYVVHLLKVHSLYVSLGKFYKRNVWIVPLLPYSKCKANISHSKGLKSIQGFQVRIQDFYNLYTCVLYYRDKLVAFYLIII